MVMRTLYTLVDSRGQLAICTVQQLDGRWELTVRRGKGILVTEHHPEEGAAMARAEEIRTSLIGVGWRLREG